MPGRCLYLPIDGIPGIVARSAGQSRCHSLPLSINRESGLRSRRSFPRPILHFGRLAALTPRGLANTWSQEPGRARSHARARPGRDARPDRAHKTNATALRSGYKSNAQNKTKRQPTELDKMSVLYPWPQVFAAIGDTPPWWRGAALCGAL